MCVTDRHDVTLVVKVVLNLNTTNQANSLNSLLKISEPLHKKREFKRPNGRARFKTFFGKGESFGIQYG